MFYARGLGEVGGGGGGVGAGLGLEGLRAQTSELGVLRCVRRLVFDRA